MKDIQATEEAAPCRLFDQNVLSPLLRESKFGDRLCQSIRRDHPLLSDSDYRYLSPDSTILEVLGVVPDFPDKPPKFKVGGKNSQEIVKEVANFACNFYSSRSELLTKKLRTAWEDKRGHCLIDQVDLFDAVTRPLHETAFEDNLRFTLLFDYVSKYDYPRSVERGVFSFLADQCIFKSQEVGRNKATFRLVKKLWDSSYSYYAKPTNSDEIKRDAEECNKLLKMKSKRDFLDCDISHFAVFGVSDPSGKEFSRVHSFTRDSEETILLRIRFLKGVVESRREFRNRKFGQEHPEDFVSRRNGIVAFVSDDGSIRRTVNVESECEPLVFVR